MSSKTYRDLLATIMASPATQTWLANLDVSKSYREILAAAQASPAVQDNLGALAKMDVSKSYRDMLAAIETSPAMETWLANLDVSKSYRDMLAAIETSPAMETWLANLDVSKSYRDLLTEFIGSTTAQDVLARTDTAQLFAQIVAGIEAEPGTDAAVDEVTRRVSDAAVEATPLSDEARLAIAIYVALLAFTLCAWFYVVHTEAAKLILDASAPATWCLFIGKLIYQKLGPPNK
jgi:hypothetical protein